MAPIDQCRRLTPALVVALFFCPLASAQITPTRIYSRPELPSTEALQRLNLRLSWRATVPMDGAKDSLVQLRLIGRDLIAVTRSGIVQRMDAETGKVLWRTTVGKPYTMLPYVTANSRSVYVIANAKLYALDRTNGRRKWQYDLPGSVSAGPEVDEEQIYVPFSTSTLSAYYLPFVTDTDSDGSGDLDQRSIVYGSTDPDDAGPRPRPTWTDRTNIQLTFQPLQTNEVVFTISPAGEARGFAKVPREGAESPAVYEFRTEGRIRVPGSSYGEAAYIGSEDANLYAINMTTGKLLWRHSAGTAISRRPVALAKDVYVTSDKEGMARIDRETGDTLWRVPSGRGFTTANVLADQFLAANERFVYATDHSGRLLVLDRKRGVQLSLMNICGFQLPVMNEVTDRLYLAANNGLVVCLHDRDVPDPIRHRKSLENAASPLVKILNQNVTEAAMKELKFGELIAEWRKRYKIGILVVEKAFKGVGVPNILDVNVRPPRTEDRPFKEHIQKILKQVDALYQIEGQTLLILPAKGKP